MRDRLRTKQADESWTKGVIHAPVEEGATTWGQGTLSRDWLAYPHFSTGSRSIGVNFTNSVPGTGAGEFEKMNTYGRVQTGGLN